MQKDKKQIMLNILADAVRNNIQNGKAPTTLAAEYGMSTSIISKVLNGTKNPEFTTFFNLAEILDIKPSELLAEIEKCLGEDFTTIDI